jgi:hypothetical protein
MTTSWLKPTVTENEVTIELSAECALTLTHCALIYGDKVVSLPGQLTGGGMLIFPRQTELKLDDWLQRLGMTGGQLPYLIKHGNRLWNEDQKQRMLYLMSFRSRWKPELLQMRNQVQPDSSFDLSEISRERFCFLAWASGGAVDIDYVDAEPMLGSQTLIRCCFSSAITEEGNE